MQRTAGEILTDLRNEESAVILNQRLNFKDDPDANLRDWPDADVSISGQESQENPTFSNDQNQYEFYDYNFHHKQRGCFIIFDQMDFDYDLNLKHRIGSERDYLKLENIAKILGYEYIQTFHNKTSREILDILEKMSKANHKDYDCFACAILTHGGENDVLYAQDKQMNLSDFTSPFKADKCKSLAGKPKFFFIQACRGTKPDKGAEIEVPKSSVQSDCIPDYDLDQVDQPPPCGDTMMEEEMQTICIPTQADFLIAHASSPDTIANRNEMFGSWFIDSLYLNVMENGTRMGIMQIMMKVNSRVAAYRANRDGSMQMPSFSCTLRSDVYFKGKEQPYPNTIGIATETIQTNASGAMKTWEETEPEKHMYRVERTYYSSVVADEW